MVTRARWIVGFILLLSALTAGAAAPHLEKQGTAMRLIVQGKPMLVLGGELGNSSASSAARSFQLELRHVRLAPGEYQIQRVRLYRYR